MADGSDTSAPPDRNAGRETRPDGGPVPLGWVPKLGVGAWSFVGFVVATVIVVVALGAVSEIVLPLTFAAVLAVVFKPLVGILQRHRVQPTLAAGLVVLGLLALMALVVVATVRGVVEQADQLGAAVDAALDKVAGQTDAVGVDQAALDQARAAAEEAEPTVTGGVLTQLVAGIDKLIGLASGLILGALIMYYLLKDGTRLRRALSSPRSTPGYGTRSTTSSVMPSGSCVTTGGAAPSCRPSCRWSSAWPRCCSGSRWCSPSWW